MANTSLRHGFSLLELTLVLTIIGTIAAFTLTLTASTVERDKIGGSFSEIAVIDDALGEHALRLSRLPCPARLDLLSNDAEYGREATDCADASPPSGLIRIEYPAASGNYVRIGTVPIYNLRLPDEYLGDDWGNRYLYAVSENLITTADLGSVGNITVQDDSATSISDEIAWVVLSPWRLRKGCLPHQKRHRLHRLRCR